MPLISLDPATRALMEDVAEQAAQKAVIRTLTSLGVDHTNPIETQRDFAALRDMREMLRDPEYQKDMVHLRTWRKTMDAATKKGILTAVGMLVTAALAGVGLYVRSKGWWPFS